MFSLQREALLIGLTIYPCPSTWAMKKVTKITAPREVMIKSSITMTPESSSSFYIKNFDHQIRSEETITMRSFQLVESSRKGKQSIRLVGRRYHYCKIHEKPLMISSDFFDQVSYLIFDSDTRNCFRKCQNLISNYFCYFIFL